MTSAPTWIETVCALNRDVKMHVANGNIVGARDNARAMVEILETQYAADVARRPTGKGVAA